jgi:hypothetical protein
MSVTSEHAIASRDATLNRPARNRRRSGRSGSDSKVDVLIGAVVVAAMASPILLTNRPLMVDATNDMWMGMVMSHSLSHGIPPSFVTGQVP